LQEKNVQLARALALAKNLHQQERHELEARLGEERETLARMQVPSPT